MAAEREGFAADNSSCEHVHALCGGRLGFVEIEPSRPCVAGKLA